MHPDAGSLEFHLGVIAEHARRAYEETLDGTLRIQVFGDLPESVTAALREQASDGVEVSVHSDLLGGFPRWTRPFRAMARALPAA
jgi:hypothetical protein